MPNVLVAIGDGVEVGAQDFLKFVDQLKLEAQAMVSPRALLALAVLAVPLSQAILDATAAAAQDGLNIPLDVETAELLIQLWPDLKAYFNTLAVQPPKGVSK